MPNRVTEPVVLRVRRLVTTPDVTSPCFRREAYARNLALDGAMLSGVDGAFNAGRHNRRAVPGQEGAI